MTRDYITFDELFQGGVPFPGWSFRVSGVEKWPVIKWFAKTASLDIAMQEKRQGHGSWKILPQIIWGSLI